MTLLIFVILMITGLCVCHVIARKIPHRPSKQEVQQVRHVLAEDAWDSLLTPRNEAEPTRPKRWVYSNVEYAKMRARKLTDWFLP